MTTNVPKVPFHRRRNSILAVLLVIAIVIVAVIAISFGPPIPPHPVTPGQNVTPPSENTTAPAPSTSANQDNAGHIFMVQPFGLDLICIFN